MGFLFSFMVMGLRFAALRAVEVRLNFICSSLLQIKFKRTSDGPKGREAEPHNHKGETNGLFLCYHDIKQINSMLPCVCSVIDHTRRQNVLKTSVKHSAIASCATFFVLTTSLNRRTATWNLFVKLVPVHFFVLILYQL